MTISKFYYLTLPVGGYLFSSSLLAQITLDGTLGQSGPLSGPHYQITSNLGSQVGGNLYHSFGQFNIHQGESATFSGPETVNNIIGRVTGGSPSQINGILRSTIPNANVYLLNPSGILFGKEAELDVQGSFHASTADTLRFEDSSEFHVKPPGPSLLTVAPPSAFGFLTDTPTAITLQDSKLSLSSQKTLSLIGGNVLMEGTQPTYDSNGIMRMAGVNLLVPSGQINLASLSQRGEVKISAEGIELSESATGGEIIAHQTRINTSDDGGRIYVRAGRFELHNSELRADNMFGGSELQSEINIKAAEMTTVNGLILARTFGTHKKSGGNINIEVTGTVELTGGGQSDEYSYGGIATDSGSEDGVAPGDAGDIVLTAGNLFLKKGAIISSNAWGSGDCGNIKIAVNGLVSLSEQDNYTLTGSQISTSTGSFSETAGDGGTIELTAGELYVGGGGKIFAKTDGPGDGGKINIQVDGKARFEGASNEGGPSAVSTASTGAKATGNGGNIEFQAHELIVEEGTTIDSSTRGGGNGGDIKIQANLIHLGGKYHSYNSGLFATSSFPRQQLAGTAGNISVQANTINLVNGGKMETSTINAGGGSIMVTASKLLYLRGGSITTNVRLGDSDGGNITISQPTFVILDRASIISKAKRGYGGDIGIHSQQFLASTDKENLLDASSDILERSGNIVISAPAEDLTVDKVPLSTTFFRSALKQRCQDRDVKQIPQFSIRGCLRPPPDRVKGSLMEEDWEKIRPLWSPDFW